MRTGRAGRGRFRTWPATGTCLFSWLALCVLAACSGPAVRKEPARVHFVVEPVAARIYVDDELVGTGRVLARTNVIVTEGAHQITVEAPGFFPHDFELNAVPGVTEVKVALRKVPE